MSSSFVDQAEDFVAISFQPQVALTSGETIKVRLSAFDGPSAENIPIRSKPNGVFTFATWSSATKLLEVIVGADVEQDQFVTILLPTFAGIARIPYWPVQVGGDAVLIPEPKPVVEKQRVDFSLKNWHEVPNTHLHDYGIVNPTDGYRHRKKEPADRKQEKEKQIKLSPFEQMLMEVENERRVTEPTTISAVAVEKEPSPEKEPEPIIPTDSTQPAKPKADSVWEGVEAAGPEQLANTFSIRLVRRRVGAGGGVGLMIMQSTFSHGFFVYSVTPEGSAGKSCLVHIGDMLIAVDGVVVEGMTGEAVTGMIGGEPGTWVELSLIPAVKVTRTDADLSPFKEEHERRCLAVCPQRGMKPPYARSLGIHVEKRMPSRHHQIIYVDPMGPVGKSRRVRVGDTLLRVDGEDMSRLSSDQVNTLVCEGTDRPILLTFGDKTLPIAPMPPTEDEMRGQYVVKLDPTHEEGVDADSIGVTVGVEPTGDFVLLDIAPDSPADRCGMLREGDVVLKVDGVDVHDVPAGTLPQRLATNWRAKIPIELYMQERPPEDVYAPLTLVVLRGGPGVWRGPTRRFGVGAMLERVLDEGEEGVRIADYDLDGPLGQCSHKLTTGSALVSVNDMATAGKQDAEITDLLLGDNGAPVLLSLAYENPWFVPTPPPGQTRWKLPLLRQKVGDDDGVGIECAYSDTLMSYQITTVDPAGPAGKSDGSRKGDLLLSVDGIAVGYKNSQEVARLLSGAAGTLVILGLGRLMEEEGAAAQGGSAVAADGDGEAAKEAEAEDSGWGDPFGKLVRSIQESLGLNSGVAAAPEQPKTAEAPGQYV